MQNDNIEDDNMSFDPPSLRERIDSLDPEIRELIMEIHKDNNVYAATENDPEKFEAMLDTLIGLSIRKQKFIVLRYGFNNGGSQKLREMAEELGVTRERARQIDNRYRKRLQDPSIRKKKLHDYLDDESGSADLSAQ